MLPAGWRASQFGLYGGSSCSCGDAPCNSPLGPSTRFSLGPGVISASAYVCGGRSSYEFEMHRSSNGHAGIGSRQAPASRLPPHHKIVHAHSHYASGLVLPAQKQLGSEPDTSRGEQRKEDRENACSGPPPLLCPLPLGGPLQAQPQRRHHRSCRSSAAEYSEIQASAPRCSQEANWQNSVIRRPSASCLADLATRVNLPALQGSEERGQDSNAVLRWAQHRRRFPRLLFATPARSGKRPQLAHCPSQSAERVSCRPVASRVCGLGRERLCSTLCSTR